MPTVRTVAPSSERRVVPVAEFDDALTDPTAPFALAGALGADGAGVGAGGAGDGAGAGTAAEPTKTCPMSSPATHCAVDAHATVSRLSAPARWTGEAPAGAFGLNVISLPSESTIVHCDVDGQATDAGELLIESIATIAGRPEESGLNVISLPS